MKNLIYNVVKFMDCYIAPMFVNGRKQEAFFKRMQEKYPYNEHRTDSKN
jgi:hypothetical protein